MHPTGSAVYFGFIYKHILIRPFFFYLQLIKGDAQTKASKTWQEAGCYPSEPVFVPAPGATAEDEGIIQSCKIYGDEG